MDIFQAISLAIIQGLTEFLPVSSSGHLVILQNIFGLKEPEIFFDICVHVGTLFAICIVFFKEINSIIKSIFQISSLSRSSGSLKNLFSENDDIRMAILIIIASIPTAILGLLFHKIAGKIFSSVHLVGIMLLATGAFLWTSRSIKSEGNDVKGITVGKALIIGLAQGIAVLPGISRSSLTIVTALFIGVGRETAAKYSFLMSIPAILGALLLELDGTGVPTNSSTGIILLSVVVSAIIGFAALKVLLNMVKQKQLYYFAPYCWLIGIITIITALFN